MTSNAKVFVLSIIGVQSSGKSTLLNALFSLQCPVSAGRCTRGIYCHLVAVDEESLHTEYDYLLVVDTEGLRATHLTGKSTFKDNELAHFQLNSLFLLPTEASENHSQSCICSYFHLHCPRICLLQD